MPADNEHGNREKNEEERKIPDFAQVMKELYFQSEEAWTRAVKDFVGSQSFIPLLEQISGQYLSLHKATSQNMDKLLANYPIPTKKDIARVAELVVSVEDKVDQLETQISNNMNSLASSLIKLVEYQSTLKDEVQAIHQDVRLLLDKSDQTVGIALLTSTPAESEPPSSEVPERKPRGRKKKNTGEETISEVHSADHKAAKKPGNGRRKKQVLEEMPEISAIQEISENDKEEAPTGRQRRSKNTIKVE
ncbi:MAG TPA: hypothetical protein VN426_14580 [Syntrophomonadaceae bacterium]|nr:hypothetical protein [Syntrophomonadaceae bacterium]